MKNKYLIILWLCFIASDLYSQITVRERPKEWDSLAYGARFFDRFLPMSIQGKLTTNTWGAKNVIPRYTDNGIEDNTWSYWGGNAILGKDGNYHLIVCRWREDSKKGHHQWPKSIVVHAISKNSFGPYKVKNTVGNGHNPELFQLKDGRFVVYVIGSYYISNSLDGPWEKKKFKFNKRDRKIPEGLSNLTFAKREDGSFLMICRGGGIWFSQTGITPYNLVSNHSVYPPYNGEYEDPVVWRTDVQYHMIVNDWKGRIAYHLRSKNGVKWKVEPGEAYIPGISIYDDGTKVDWYKYERIKVLQDAYGRPTQAHFAVIDTIKANDAGSDSHSSKQIMIPLTKEKRLTILNRKEITKNTKKIKVEIAAEDGFNPNTDIDLSSLRFGASELVNYGKGSTVIKTNKKGKNLELIFDGQGNGITKDNFVAKLIGKTREGKLLFGYARLPRVVYIESILSARMPVFIENGSNMEVEVENFGQIVSKPSKIKVSYIKNNEEIEIASGTIPKLSPFQNTSLKLNYKDVFQKGVSYPLIVTINSPNQDPVLFEKTIIPLAE